MQEHIAAGEEESSSCTDDLNSSVSNRSRLYKSRSLPHLIAQFDSGVGSQSNSYSGVDYDTPGAGNSVEGQNVPRRNSSHCYHQHVELEKVSYTIAANKLVADIRQLLTLKQHYYPEGGWGWVIIFVSVLVQILTHGLQVGSGVIWTDIVAKFGSEIAVPAGKNFLELFVSKNISRYIIRYLGYINFGGVNLSISGQ